MRSELWSQVDLVSDCCILYESSANDWLLLRLLFPQCLNIIIFREDRVEDRATTRPCVHVVVDCDDNDPCTFDYCDVSTGPLQLASCLQNTDRTLWIVFLFCLDDCSHDVDVWFQVAYLPIRLGAGLPVSSFPSRRGRRRLGFGCQSLRYIWDKVVLSSDGINTVQIYRYYAGSWTGICVALLCCTMPG
jgi:hypothetical protein